MVLRFYILLHLHCKFLFDVTEVVVLLGKVSFLFCHAYKVGLTFYLANETFICHIKKLRLKELHSKVAGKHVVRYSRVACHNKSFEQKNNCNLSETNSYSCFTYEKWQLIFTHYRPVSTKRSCMLKAVDLFKYV